MKFPENIGAALIDMDGVLYDSMPYHCMAWHIMFKELGIETDRDEFFLYEGMTGGATIAHIIKRELGREAEEEEKLRLYSRKSELFKSLGEKRSMPYADRMLECLRDIGLKTVLVTGSAQGSLLSSLDKDYPGFFPAERRVTALDVKKGKPDPEPYLKGAEKAGLSPEQCMVIENAPLGVRSAKAAGCFTVAVMTGPIPRERFEAEGADLIMPSMEQWCDFIRKSYKI